MHKPSELSAKVAWPQPGLPRGSDTYTPERGLAIAELYGEGKSLKAIAAQEGMPPRSTIRRWRQRHEDFESLIGEARQAKAEFHASEALRELDVDLHDVEPKIASATVNLAGKRSDYHRWMARCMDQATYGDQLKVDATVTTEIRGVIGSPLVASSGVVLNAVSQPLDPAHALPEGSEGK